MARSVLILATLMGSLLAGTLSFGLAAPADDPPATDDKGRLTKEAVSKLKSPIPYDKESVAKGKALFLHACTECHGSDGKSQLDVIANATDLTDPPRWTSGTSRGEIFRSIRDGAGDAMPGFKTQVAQEEDMWHMVNFILSLWPAKAREAATAN